MDVPFLQALVRHGEERSGGGFRLTALMYIIAIMTLMYMSAVGYDAAMTAPKEQHEKPINQARNKLAEIIERAHYYDEPTLLQNRGRPLAVVVGVDFYERALLAFGEERVTVPLPSDEQS